MKKFVSLTLALVALLALAGCSLPQPKHWSVGTGEIKIVASTNVWGSVANLVAGRLATVDAIIFNSTQDPHSYELTARDQLLINNADIVIMNGGGYDDFMKQAVSADPTPALVVNAFQASGVDPTRNEHIWYDVDQAPEVASAIGAAIVAVKHSSGAEVEAQVIDFREKISERKAHLEALRAAPKAVFLTEPLITYLVEDAGYADLTPSAFSEAVEEERDIPPTVLKEATDILSSGKVEILCVTVNTETAQIKALENFNVAEARFSELLNQHEDNYEITGDYFDMLDSAIGMLGYHD